MKVYCRVLENTWGEFQRTSEALFPVYDHYTTTGHTTTVENFSCGLGGPEPHKSLKRSYIHKGQQFIPNKNTGTYHLSHIRDKVLFNTSELKIIHPFGYSIWHIGNNTCHLLNTCGHNTCHSGFPSATHTTITQWWQPHLPDTSGDNICQQNNDQNNYSVVSIYHSVHKKGGYTNTIYLMYWKTLRITFTPDLRKPCCRPGESLSSTEIKILF